MHISIALYGAARVVTGQPLVDLSFDIPAITLGQVLEKMIATYPRARPYLLDESGSLPSYMRVLINNIRPNPDATLATLLRDKDHVSLLVAVAGGTSHIPVGAQFIGASPIDRPVQEEKNKNVGYGYTHT